MAKRIHWHNDSFKKKANEISIDPINGIQSPNAQGALEEIFDKASNTIVLEGSYPSFVAPNLDTYKLSLGALTCHVPKGKTLILDELTYYLHVTNPYGIANADLVFPDASYYSKNLITDGPYEHFTNINHVVFEAEEDTVIYSRLEVRIDEEEDLNYINAMFGLAARAVFKLI